MHQTCSCCGIEDATDHQWNLQLIETVHVIGVGEITGTRNYNICIKCCKHKIVPAIGKAKTQVVYDVVKPKSVPRFTKYLIGLATVFLFSGSIASTMFIVEKLRTEPTPEPVIVPISPLETTQTINLVVCDAYPGQFIARNQDGVWIKDVKSVELSIDTDGLLTSKCVIYQGAIRPTNPLTKGWKITAIQTMSVEDFKKLIGELQI